MRFLPRSAFGKTVFLIGFLLLINQLVSYFLVAVYVIQPTLQQTNHLIAKQIKVVFIDFGAEDQLLSKELTEKFQQVTGIHVLTEAQALRNGLNNAIYYHIFLMKCRVSSAVQPKCGLSKIDSFHFGFARHKPHNIGSKYH